MKKILISPENNVHQEIDTICELFTLSLDVFHIRKPKFTENQMCQYIDQFPLNFRKKMMIHSHHHLIHKYELNGAHFKSNSVISIKGNHKHTSRSCHSIQEASEHSKNHDYVFLSPIFDSISKQSYRSSFNEASLKDLNMNHRNIIALGGVTSKEATKVKTLGFKGIALFGTIWGKEKRKDRLNEFRAILNNYEEINALI